MASVPGVECESFFEGHRAQGRMAEGTLPLRVGEFAQHQHPALVQGIDQCQRHVDGGALGLGQLGPKIFHVGLDGGLVFGERQLETNVGIHVAVGDLMGDPVAGSWVKSRGSFTASASWRARWRVRWGSEVKFTGVSTAKPIVLPAAMRNLAASLAAGNGVVARSFAARASCAAARRMAMTAPCGIMPWRDSQAAISSREIRGLFSLAAFKSITTNGATRRSAGIWPAAQVPGMRGPGAMMRVLDSVACGVVAVCALVRSTTC